jgi:hypothetical protein
MASYYLCPWATVFQYFTDTGIVLSGGLVYTYLAGTTTPQVTYTDITGTVPNANPIVLGSNGRLPNVAIWQQSGIALKIVVTDANGNPLGPTFDQLTGINDLSVSNSALADPASGFGADLVANAMRSYDIFSTARAADVPILQTGQTLIVDFEGGVSIADGLGGEFYWNATSSATDDGLTILAPTALAGSPGRYLRLNQNLQFYAVKAATTSRASTTTVTIDPDLQVSIPAGSYSVEGWLNDARGTSSGGLKGNISFSGTITTGNWGMTGSGTAVTPVALSLFAATGEMQSAQSGVGNMLLSGGLQCSTGGTIGFYWAQQSSNATASVVGAGSYLRVTRLSSGTGAFSPLTHTYNTAGIGTETIPAGASTLTLEIWGGSGGGAFGYGTPCAPEAGAGGGSGGYSRTVINVAAANGQTILYSVGVSGTGGGGVGGASSASTGTFSLATMTANGGSGGAPGGSTGVGGSGGTASGGNQANTTGNTGENAGGTPPTGAAGVIGINGTGGAGGNGGGAAGSPGHGGQPGNVGLVIFSYV